MLDSADSFDPMKAFFQTGTNGVVPVDKFYSWCGDRANYVGSAYYKSYGVNASHPEGLLFDRDGNIRYHIVGFIEGKLQAMEAVIQHLTGL